MGKGRRVVEFAGRAPGKQQGRGPRLWAFSYEDFARLLGTTAQALRSRTSRGSFDPGDLEAVCREWASVRGLAAALVLAVAIVLGGCGEITSADAPDLGGMGGSSASGVGGSDVAGFGGMMVVAGTGGATPHGTGGRIFGTGGSTVSGTGGAATVAYQHCSTFGWNPSGAGQCFKNTSPGRYVYGWKDDRQCHQCDSPTRPAGVPECLFAATDNLCVLSCDECEFR